MLNNSVRPIKSLVNLLGHTFSQFNSNKDYFKILGVKSTATDMEIKTAFYALAKKYHPDHSKGFQKQFKQINEAYSILSDPAIKKDYEQSRSSSSQSTSSNFYSHQQSQHYQNYYQNQRNAYRDHYETYNKFRQEQEQRKRPNLRYSYHQQFNFSPRNRSEDIKRTQHYFVMSFTIFIFTIVLVLLTKPKRNNYKYEYITQEPQGKYSIEFDTYDPTIYNKQDFIYHGTPLYQGKYPVLRVERNNY